MSGLGRILEEEGLATVSISLIREQTEKMRPPRALWVPFIMGRPFGVPGDSGFQKRVLRAALALLERPEGPVLVDYPEDAPVDETDPGDWVCPVSFPTAVPQDSPAERLRREIQELRTWYDIGLQRRGRTTVGVSGLDMAAIATLFVSLAAGDIPANPRGDLDLGEVIRLAAEDIKAFYFEAAAAQPGSATANALQNWFWHRTVAGKLILKARETCRASDDPVLREKGAVLAPPDVHLKGSDDYD